MWNLKKKISKIQNFQTSPVQKFGPNWPFTTFHGNYLQHTTVCKISSNIPLFWNSSLLCKSSFKHSSLVNSSSMQHNTRAHQARVLCKYKTWAYCSFFLLWYLLGYFFFFTPNFIWVPPIYTTNELLGFPKYFLLYYSINHRYFISHYLNRFMI